MLIYLICFSVSVGFACWANRTKKKKLFYLFSCLSILTMVLLAGLRDYSIGIDTMNYKTHPAYWASAIKSETLAEYFRRYFAAGYKEPLFALFIGLISRITHNFSAFLLAAHAVIVSCIYIGSFRLRRYVEPAWILLLYYLFLYNQSLNGIRQHMVLAIIFVVFADIQEGKFLRYCIVVAVSCLMHTTALLALIYPVLYFILNWNWEPLNKKRWYRWGIMIALVLMAIVLMKPVSKLLITLGIFSQKYDYFFRNDVVSPALIAIAFVVFGLCAVFYFRKEMAQKCDEFEFWALGGVIYALLLQFSWIVILGKRFSLYCALPFFALIALIESAQTEPKKKWIIRAMIVGAGLAYWGYVYAFRNASQTIPYSFVF